ncbi:armadillo repeat-containing protein 7-like [Centruroides vittatus]|uniref:armadillo repeat-containing protein 7-like n=1 Tax=Centruroides vittatus TaxID=120091 RepID=UPI0035100099
MARYSSKERYSYLQQLVTEFQDSSSQDAKKQVLANLGNFAYDPINYDHFRNLNIIALFLDQLDEEDEELIEFAIGGLCNLCLDKKNKDFILQNSNVKKIVNCLSSPREETVLSALTTLIFLVTPESKSEIVTPSVVDCIIRFQKSSNKRLSNLANVFLEDYCTHQQIEAVKKLKPVGSSSSSSEDTFKS